MYYQILTLALGNGRNTQTVWSLPAEPGVTKLNEFNVYASLGFLFIAITISLCNLSLTFAFLIRGIKA